MLGFGRKKPAMRPVPVQSSGMSVGAPEPYVPNEQPAMDPQGGGMEQMPPLRDARHNLGGGAGPYAPPMSNDVQQIGNPQDIFQPGQAGQGPTAQAPSNPQNLNPQDLFQAHQDFQNQQQQQFNALQQAQGQAAQGQAAQGVHLPGLGGAAIPGTLGALSMSKSAGQMGKGNAMGAMMQPYGGGTVGSAIGGAIRGMFGGGGRGGGQPGFAGGTLGNLMMKRRQQQPAQPMGQLAAPGASGNLYGQ